MIPAEIAPWLAGVLGLLIGSFLNVCILRLPWDYSVVTPPSHCYGCGRFLSWWENVPVLSWALLRGRCRSCGRRVSGRYALVELLTGLLFFWSVTLAGWTWDGLRLCAFSAILIELIVTDLDWRILPDEFTKGGAVLGLILAAIAPLPPGLMNYLLPHDAAPNLASFLNAGAASLLLSGALWAVGTLYLKLRGREGLGFGDVKMVMMVGAFLGIERSVLALMGGSVLGSVVGLLYIRLTGKDASTYELPFGSFIGISALAVGLWPVNPWQP